MSKINSFSNWRNILYIVLQTSVLGPLLFNAFFCNLSLIDIANYIDNTTPYTMNNSTINY